MTRMGAKHLGMVAMISAGRCFRFMKGSGVVEHNRCSPHSMSEKTAQQPPLMEEAAPYKVRKRS